MLINSNLMLLVMLLCAGVLPIVNSKRRSVISKSPVCNKYILPLNAIWVNRENCEDSNQFKCKKGYQSVVNTVCDNGNWNLEPTCQAVECASGAKISNSNHVTQSGTFGEEFRFDCLNGSTGTMTCGKDGDWTILVPCEDCKYNYAFGKYVSIDYTGQGEPNLAACSELCDTENTCRTFLYINDICRRYQQPIISVNMNFNLTSCTAKCDEMKECVTFAFRDSACNLFDTTLNKLYETIHIGDSDEECLIAENICR